MLNQLNKSGNQIQSKFIQAVSITAMAIIILLKPGIAKGNENLDRELSELIKKNPDKELIIQEDQNDYSNANFNVAGSNPPTEQEVKNLFLNMKSLTSIEKQEFLELRNDSKKNPNWDIMREQIQMVADGYGSENNKAIFICFFLDPFQTTSLGKQAFQIINTDKHYQQYAKTISRNYVASLELKKTEEELKKTEEELKKTEEELKKLEEVSKMLQKLIDIYKNYQNIFLFFV